MRIYKLDKSYYLIVNKWYFYFSFSSFSYAKHRNYGVKIKLGMHFPESDLIYDCL